MAEAAPVSRPALLLVEDEAPLAAALSENLSMEYEVEIAGTVEEARLLLSTQKFALILSDHMLPGRAQGLDFLVEALQRQPEAKRILMTGYLNPDLIGRSVSLAQLSACLIKPVDIARLKQELRRALAG
ncbi:response regulator [Oleiharenicola lentus]|jgi:DNA-binding NtrC family response regulator|uniref:Response regulator n=1 Tax=Oleiharenicola lentus TaxID=2508720 RepID=A0A4Q1CBG9_9BACT|nr:response regulator [Oleiharenicola lentus]RXK56457.1 response regulator [Oleiharenicola lentus]